MALLSLRQRDFPFSPYAVADPRSAGNSVPPFPSGKEISFFPDGVGSPLVVKSDFLSCAMWLTRRAPFQIDRSLVGLPLCDIRAVTAHFFSPLFLLGGVGSGDAFHSWDFLWDAKNFPPMHL